ncbi:MAG: hypothetical protein KatS3mg046_732 [Bellilinea sp.]|nr:MAG: hypothetical protein KatS3mg046_732 [Bellilinea sp.]
MYEPIIIRLEVGVEDIEYILQSRGTEIKDRKAYLEYLRKLLPGAMDAHLYDEIKYLTDSYTELEQCPHRRTTVITTGGYHYSAGEVWDDLKDVEICLDCGKQLTDPEPTNADDEAEEVIF